jgi:hypothetical protein
MGGRAQALVLAVRAKGTGAELAPDGRYERKGGLPATAAERQAVVYL